MAEEDKATGDTAWTKYAPAGSLAERINTMPSANANVNRDGKSIMSDAGKGGAKSTDGGMDLSMNATNPRGKHTNKEQGPSATCMGSGSTKSSSKSY